MNGAEAEGGRRQDGLPAAAAVLRDAGDASGQEVSSDLVVRGSTDELSPAKDEDLRGFVLYAKMFGDVPGEFSASADLDQRHGDAGLLGLEACHVTVGHEAGDARGTVFENDGQIQAGEPVVVFVSG